MIPRAGKNVRSFLKRHSNIWFSTKLVVLCFCFMQLMFFLRVTVKRNTRPPWESTSPFLLPTTDTRKYVNSTSPLTLQAVQILTAKDNLTSPAPALEIRNSHMVQQLISCPALKSMGNLDANRQMDLQTKVSQSELDDYVFQTQQGKAKEAVVSGNAQLMGGSHLNRTTNAYLSLFREGYGVTAEIRCGNYIYLPGGHWRPADCIPQSKIAIIIPFRNRHYQLMIFLRYMIPFLQKQRLEFAIYVVNQENDFLFNKGILMNAGFLESPKFAEWDCIIFHDIDHIPQHEGNPYHCVDLPRHLMGGADNRNYRPPYGSIFGGVTAFNKNQFKKVNGFSNKYWGWCCEDDDMGWRVAVGGLKRTRYKGDIAFYKVISEKHTRGSHRHEAENRAYLRKRSKARMLQDGVNSVKYNITHLEFLTLYTNISITFENNE
ncbi:beta-1,4-galactosyltransferase 4-like [Asterias amurensis]|uniref:beta-1,4-galactosyltransferase 4-like n=1 Tax=Asterias amurensis TaxID=7602 RepID=UPI003AB40B34